MLIAIALLVVFYIMPYCAMIWTFRDDLRTKKVTTHDLDEAVVILTVSLVPLVSWFFLYYVATVKYKVPGPYDLWSRFVLWLLGR